MEFGCEGRTVDDAEWITRVDGPSACGARLLHRLQGLSAAMANQPYGSSDFDSRQFRTAMGQFCTNVTVISTIDADDKPVGFACQSFAALSLDPPLVLFCR